jgi:lysozyme family protein
MNKFILTEDERNSISKLHKNFITEQAVQDTVIQPGVFNQKVLDLQNHLNTKFNAGLTADGKLGPKTLAAAQTALQGKIKQDATEIPSLKPKPLAPIQTGTETPQNSNYTGPDADNEVNPTLA